MSVMLTVALCLIAVLSSGLSFVASVVIKLQKRLAANETILAKITEETAAQIKESAWAHKEITELDRDLAIQEAYMKALVAHLGLEMRGQNAGEMPSGKKTFIH
jgi:hypothetical protein